MDTRSTDMRHDAEAPTVAGLLETALGEVAAVFGRIDGAGWVAPSPCTGWTVRQTGNHLLGGLTVLLRIVGEEPVRPDELDPQLLANTDRLGDDPVAALGGLAARAVPAFGSPDILERHYDLPAPGITGQLIGTVATLETLVHGWDVATGAGVDYRPDEAVVATVHAFAAAAVDATQRAKGLFGPAVAVGADAAPFTALLGHLGRSAG
jgi:uncharacterized protein (TIGR03086 family)